MRAGRAFVLLVALFAVATVVPARADESITAGRWAGSTLAPSPRPEACGDADDVCGRVFHEVYRFNAIDVGFTITAVETSPGCTLPTAAGYSDVDSGAVLDRALSFECNGTYRIAARLSAPFEADARIDRQVTVAQPPPDVAAPTATANPDRSVLVSWSALAGPPKDFRGYTVLRTIGDVSEVVATVGPEVTSWTDSELPREGATATYQVRTRRAGARPSSEPTAEVASAGSAAEPVVVAPAPVEPGGDGGAGGTDGPGTDGGDPGSGDPGGTDGGGTGGGTGGGSGGTGGRRPSGPINTGGRPSGGITVPRVGSPSRNFFPPLLAPPVVDTGFDEELPFGDREPGDEEPVLPDDELASGDLGERLPGRGLVVPVATGLVLAVWGLHLRFLARASRPGYVDDDRIEILPL